MKLAHALRGWSFAWMLLACSASTPGTPGEPGQCTAVTCTPPACCGSTCSANSDCCRGTVCLASGRCGPELCTVCTTGCVVDFGTCMAECAPPASCNGACTSNSDCATGTHCATTTTGTMVCFPDSCAECGGLHPSCRTHTDCTTECIAPSSCGNACTTDAECGTGSTCHAFLDGQHLCVPMAFSDECNACAPDFCQFHITDCSVECIPAPAPDAGPLPDTGPPVEIDAGPLASPDASTIPPDDAGSVAGRDAGPACGDCCAACTTAADCCSGRCGVTGSGRMQCIPAECAECSFGCNFHCPR